VIRSFRHKGLKDLWETGKSPRVSADLQKRVIRRLDALAAALKPEDMNIPGFDFHVLPGKPQHYSVHINGPWCITFGWGQTDAIAVDLEQYH
jgi:proteic killer suppression protein